MLLIAKFAGPAVATVTSALVYYLQDVLWYLFPAAASLFFTTQDRDHHLRAAAMAGFSEKDPEAQVVFWSRCLAMYGIFLGGGITESPLEKSPTWISLEYMFAWLLIKPIAWTWEHGWKAYLAITGVYELAIVLCSLSG